MLVFFTKVANYDQQIMSLKGIKMSSLSDKLYPSNEEIKEKIKELKSKKSSKSKDRKKPIKKK